MNPVADRITSAGEPAPRVQESISYGEEQGGLGGLMGGKVGKKHKHR